MRLLLTFTTGIDTFFFRKVTASGFGLMRVAWSFTAFIYFLMQWSDVTEFYSNAGILPTSLAPLITRSVYHFTILQWMTTPEAVFTLYLLLLFTLACAALGLSSRLMTITATLLLFSFHERNPFTLGGGDTVLRNLGFLLCIAPGIAAFSLDRLEMQWREWKRRRSLLPPLRMPIWPYRLLLWQLIVIYGTSIWFKSLGTMWWQGTAVGAALHHPTFVRLPLWIADLIMPFTPFIDMATLGFHALWLTLLIPQRLWLCFPLLGPVSRKRWAIAIGILFHGSILLLMDAGSFSLAIFSAYLGLLLDEDFIAIHNFFNRRWYSQFSIINSQFSKIAVLYDGKCGLCQRSIFLLTLCDHLRRLRCIDYWKTAERKAVAPKLTIATLDRAMHVIFPPYAPTGAPVGRPKPITYKGFDGFRELAANLPPLWPLLPFLYAPGMTTTGRWVYARIAARRKRCKNNECIV